jgi:hypothetical protein
MVFGGAAAAFRQNIMARMRDGVIEPKSVLQILVVFRHKSLRPLGLSLSELIHCLLIGLRSYTQKHAHNMAFLFFGQFSGVRAHERRYGTTITCVK